MKTKSTLNKKLVLNKKTIVELNANEATRIMGGQEWASKAEPTLCCRPTVWNSCAPYCFF